MKKPVNLDERLLDEKSIQSVVIHFGDNTSHHDTLYQAINGLSRKRFAPEKEIIEEWLAILKAGK